MKHDRGRQAASVVRAPNLIVIDIAQQRWRSYVFRWRELVHQMIAADLDEHPEMMEVDLPSDMDDWVVRLAREMQQSQPLAPAEDELHAGATVEEVVQPVATGRSFWSYAEDTLPIPALT